MALNLNYTVRYYPVDDEEYVTLNPVSKEWYEQ
jgi:hypothetical protein